MTGVGVDITEVVLSVEASAADDTLRRSPSPFSASFASQPGELILEYRRVDTR